MRRVFFPVLLLAVVALLAAACGDGDAEATATSTSSSSATQPAGGTPPEDTVPDVASGAAASDIAGFQLEDLTVAVGTTVTWTNRDAAQHTTTSGIPDDVDGIWGSPFLVHGQQFSFTFNQPGVFPYWCRLHPFMTASVTVAG